jgi:hypothetical protein
MSTARKFLAVAMAMFVTSTTTWASPHPGYPPANGSQDRGGTTFTPVYTTRGGTTFGVTNTPNPGTPSTPPSSTYGVGVKFSIGDMGG